MASFMQQHFPAPAEAEALPESELGLIILRLAVEHQQGHLLSRHTIGLEGTWRELGPEAQAPGFRRAVVEAWDWLAVNRLVARTPGETGESAYVTRRGERVLAAAKPLELLLAEERLAVELHPRIEQRARRQFLLGEYDLAALAALREVEIRVRALAGRPAGDIGVKLMRQAFGPGGPLADPEQEPGEVAATMDLFASAIGVFKNPSSHREVSYDDPTMAAEIVLFADLLHRMLDKVAARLGKAE